MNRTFILLFGLIAGLSQLCYADKVVNPTRYGPPVQKWNANLDLWQVYDPTTYVTGGITWGSGLSATGTTASFAPTELESITWGPGTGASLVWTFDVSGATNPTMTTTATGTAFSHNISGATYGSDGSITDAELLKIDDGATTEIPVGGGAGSAMVWTTATGTGAPVRAGSPALTGTVSVTGTTTESSAGAELLTTTEDRDFSGAGNWSGTDWTVGGGVATHTAGANNFVHTLAAVATNTYQISATVVTTTAGTLAAQMGGVSGSAVGQSTGTLTQHTWVITATATTSLRFVPNSVWAGTIDDVTVKLLTPTTAVIAGKNSDTTTGIGIRAGGTGLYNTLVGYQAGQFLNGTGQYNSFFGYGAGYANTTGADNTFLGFYAGTANTTGANNTFLGRSAGYANTTGANNTFLGYYAGYSNTTGAYNTFLGYSAGWYVPVAITTATAAAGTELGVGTYYYRVAYTLDSANTALGASKSVTTTTNNQQVSLSGIPTYSGPKTCTARLIYRTKVNGGTGDAANSYYLITTIADNVTTVYTDSTTDGTVGAVCDDPDYSIVLGYNAKAYRSSQMVVGSDDAPLTTIYLGEGVVGVSPAAVTIAGSGGSGTNDAGAGLILAGGKATGNAASGSVSIQTAPAGASGTDQQTLVTRLTVDADGNLTHNATYGASMGINRVVELITVAKGASSQASSTTLPAGCVVRAISCYVVQSIDGTSPPTHFNAYLTTQDSGDAEKDTIFDNLSVAATTAGRIWLASGSGGGDGTYSGPFAVRAANTLTIVTTNGADAATVVPNDSSTTFQVRVIFWYDADTGLSS